MDKRQKEREKIYNKYNGRCAYSGSRLKNDWQVDHLEPAIRNWWDNTIMNKEAQNEDNKVPSQKEINHYKSSMLLEDFRERMKTLHLRLARLPKNPRVQRSIKRKKYMLKIAAYFNITENRPFDGEFYFEKVNKQT